MSSNANDIVRELEEVEDERDALAITLARIESMNEEPIPGDIVWRISAGELPVAVWREHRGLTQADLAAAACVDLGVIRSIEAREGEPGFYATAEIARVLRVEMEMLLPVPPQGRRPR